MESPAQKTEHALTAAAAEPPKKSPLGKAIGFILVTVLIYLGFSVYTGLGKMRGALETFHWWTFAAACGLALGNYLLRFLKWEFYLAKLDVRGVPKFDSLLAYLSGFVLTITPGKVGEAYKSVVLHDRFGVPVARTAPIVLAERVTDVLGIVILIVVGSFGIRGGLLWAGVGGALVFTIVAAIASERLSMFLIGVVEKLPFGAKIAPKAREAYASLSVLLAPKNLIVPGLLSVVAWSLECLSLWVILFGFGEKVPPIPCTFFYATATLAGAIVPVGATEVGLFTQMQAYGVQDSHNTAAMILVRFATLWFAVLVGFAALSALRLRPIAKR